MDWNSFWAKVWSILSTGGIVLLKLLGVFILGYIIIRIIKKVIKKIMVKSNLDSLAQKFLLNTLSFILYFALVLVLIQTAGIPITGLLTAIAAAGLAVALALQDALTSLANGVILILTKPFKANDSVVINGISGKIVSVNFFNTIIDTWDNRRIIIPNKNMIGYQIENTNYNDKRRFGFTFKVGHSTNISELKEMVIKTICSNEKVFTNPMPECRFKEIGETGIKIEARGWANSEDCDGVELEVMQSVYNQLKKNNIDLANNSLIIYNEKRPENFVENTVLPVRDYNIQPKTTKQKKINFDEYVDNVTIKKLSKLKKIKKNKLENNN